MKKTKILLCLVIILLTLSSTFSMNIGAISSGSSDSPTEPTENTQSTIATNPSTTPTIPTTAPTTASTNPTTKPTSPTTNPTTPKVIKVSSISFNKTYIVLTVGQSAKLSATVKPSNATNKKITWSTTKSKIASVTSKGTIKGIKEGVSYIRATAQDGSKVYRNCKVVVVNFKLNQCILTKNACYTQRMAIQPKGIVVHSTGCNAPYLNRYLGPDDGILGKSSSTWNVWHPGGREVAVHGFIGRTKNGTVRTYQALPFEMACWGVGSGEKGSYNYNPGYIQFEICEDNLYSLTYFNTVYNEAKNFCAYLCLLYNIPVNDVVGHVEANARGYGSNHGDPNHWFKRFGKSMVTLRKDIRAKIYSIDPSPDLKSCNSESKVTVTTNASTNLTNKPYKDVYGKTVYTKAKLAKGTKLYWLRDTEDGYSLVKTLSGKRGYVRNYTITGKSWLSKKFYSTATKATAVYTKPVALGKYAYKYLRKGQNLPVVGVIKTGKYKGWCEVQYGYKIYYAKSTEVTC